MVDVLRTGPRESVRVVRSDADCLELDATYAPHGRPAPLHLHPGHDERFEILEGRLTVQLGGATREYGAGESFDVPRGRPHRMWNAGDEPVRARWLSTPALGTERWFRRLADLQHATAVGGRARPDPLAFAAMALRHRDVFRLVVGGSPLVGGVAIAVLGCLGRVLRREPVVGAGGA